jgi:hypothetical protein
VSWTPSTNSIARYGRPSVVSPTSSRCAMFGWLSDARICRSARKPASNSADSNPPRTILSATCCRKSACSRSASHTSPMPPRPSGRTSRYGPICSDCASAVTGRGRVIAASSNHHGSLAARSERTSAASAASSRSSAARKAARSASVRRIASPNAVSIAVQRSAVGVPRLGGALIRRR